MRASPAADKARFTCEHVDVAVAVVAQSEYVYAQFYLSLIVSASGGANKPKAKRPN